MNISAALLAGGESRRMGQDKATLVFHGKPLWQIQLDLLRKLRPREIFLSARTDPGWRPADVYFVPDQTPSRGPLSGLAATLARIQTDHLLALAIDMPLMTEDFLRSLCGAIKPSCGVAPMIGDRAEPLAAIYPKGADSDVIALVAHISEPRYPRDVYDARRPGQPHRHQRHQRLPARDHPRAIVGRKQRAGLVDVGWARILERSWLHQCQYGG